MEVVNDFDGELVNLYRTIKLHPQSLMDTLSTMWYSRELFYMYRDAKIESKPKNAIEQAARTYYVISTSYAQKRQHFGRSMSVGKITGARLYRDFRVWSERLRLVQIENRDFEKLIEEYDSPDAFFYVDPPYFGCENYYAKGEGFGKGDHERLADILKKVTGKWLLSYNDVPEIRELYGGFEIFATPEVSYSLATGKAKKVREIIIKNY